MQFIFRFCTLYILINNSSQENILLKERYKKALFDEAPKYWFNYVRQLISRNLCLNMKYDKETSLLRFLNNGQYLVKLFTNICKGFKRDSFKGTYEIKKPMGFVIKTSVDHYRIDVIHYHLDSILMLNVTFQHIYIWNKHLSNCLVGSVIVTSHSNGENSTFEYCGIHSGVVMYPPGQTVKIILNNKSFLRDAIFKISFFFSVFDTKRIHSVTIQNSDPLPKPSYILYCQNTRLLLLQFLLQTVKYRFLVIKSAYSKSDVEKYMNIYDDPGILSPILEQIEHKVFMTSTFQCVIICLNYKNDTSFPKELNYSSKMNLISNKVVLNKIETTYFSYSETNVYILHSIVKINGFINLTIVHLSYSGYNDPICTYAGLTAYYLITNAYVEISTECFSYDSFYRYRNMYSRSKDILIIIYSYKEYGSLNVYFGLTTTYCRTVTINMCAFNCHTKPKGNILCAEFYHEIKQLHEVKFHKNKKRRSHHNYLQFSVPINQCFILQLTQRIYTLRDYGGCNLDEISHNTVYKRSTIHHHVTAFLSGMFTIVANTYRKHIAKCTMV